MLTAGYLEDWTFHRTYSGAPQGGVISPVLANIYLHELDKFITEMKARFDIGQRRRASLAALAATRKIQTARRKIERRRATGKEDEVPSLIEEIREWEWRRRQMPALDPFDPGYRKLRYCRYADDFVIGIIGSKEDARRVMAEVSRWLAESLKLQVSAEKSRIAKASEGANFLGYKLKTFSNGRITRTVVNGRAVTIRVASDQMQLHLPQEKLVRFAGNRCLGNLNTGRASIRCELINNSDIDILTGYNAIMRGLAEYYKLGKLWKSQLGRLYHLWWWSFMKTLARKHRSSVRTVARRLRRGGRMGIWYEGRTKRTLMPLFRLKDVSPALASAQADLQIQAENLFRGRTDMIERLRERVCEACGASNVPVEVHHVRRMTDMHGSTLWFHVKAARTRKRVVLCRDCHVAHHAGNLRERLDEVMQA